MTANSSPGRRDRPGKRPAGRPSKDVGELWGKREVSRDTETSRDIADMARSLGFSTNEVLEIERIYQPTRKRNLK